MESSQQGQPSEQTVAPEGVQSQEGVGEQPPATGHATPPEGPVAQTGGPAPQMTTQSQEEGQGQVPETDEEGQVGENPPSQMAQASEEERNPAPEQSPVATEAQRTITGDPGLSRGEQVPQQVEGSPSAVDRPVGTSMPPPGAQSGMPLPEDRAAAAQAEGEGEEGVSKSRASWRDPKQP